VYLHGPGQHNEHAYNARVAGMVIAGSIPVTDPTKPGQWVANMRRACMVAPKYIGLLEVATADSELAGSTYTRDLPPIMGIIGA